MAISLDQYNRSEVLAMNGVIFIHNIISHILLESQKSATHD